MNNEGKEEVITNARTPASQFRKDNATQSKKEMDPDIPRSQENSDSSSDEDNETNDEEENQVEEPSTTQDEKLKENDEIQDEEIKDGAHIVDGDGLHSHYEFLSFLAPMVAFMNSALFTLLPTIVDQLEPLNEEEKENGAVEKRKHGEGDAANEPTEAAKRRKKGKNSDDVEDDGNKIVIKSELPGDVQEDTFVIDIGLTGPHPWRKFSTCYPHLKIPIPFMKADKQGCTVEGIWQGLKVFEGEGISVRNMVQQDKVMVRNETKKTGAFLGWMKGAHGTDNYLSLVEARKMILLPCYKYVLDKHLREETQKLKQIMNEEGKILLIVCTETSSDKLDPNFGAAGMLKMYLEGKWPE